MTTPTAPHFGPTHAPAYNRVPLDFSYFRDEELITERFNLLDKPMDINAANIVLRVSTGDNDAAMLPALLRLIAKHMDDKDGTGSRWKPVDLGPKKGEDPAVRRFRGPDGKVYPWDKADGFLLREKGSSRRRWDQLSDDDDASVDQDALVKLLEFLVEVAGKDRGRASS